MKKVVTVSIGAIEKGKESGNFHAIIYFLSALAVVMVLNSIGLIR
jgi:hypothetical protein